MNNREKTEKKVFSYLEEHHMISPHDNLVLGVSGGADSVCLLFLLLEYAKKVPLTLSVVHINHGIRAEATQDAAYVEELCEQNHIPFFLREVNVRELAQLEKTSEEAVGRRVRYEAFEEVAQQQDAARQAAGQQGASGQEVGKRGAVKIAVAHNANDNAETMLFHLFRGSGLKGLCGIAPVRDGIIRPILCLERQEIEDYLRERQIAWCEDCTNSGDAYTRNRIRHHILPYAEQEIVTGAVSHMNQTAEMLREAEEFLEQQTQLAMERVCRLPGQKNDSGMNEDCGCTEKGVGAGYNGRYEIDCAAFAELSPVLQKRILLTLAKELSPTGKDISLVHVRDMMSLFAEEGNRSINLPFGIVARRQYTQVLMERGCIQADEVRGGESCTAREHTQADLGGCTAGEEGQSPSIELNFSHIFPEKGAEVPANRYTKWFDYDKIVECPTLRFRQKGDYLTISDGCGGVRHKTVKDYMIDEKIPKEQRDKIPVLAVGNHVIWLIGYRISEYFKVTGNTKSILQVKLIGSDGSTSGTEEENGRTH